MLNSPKVAEGRTQHPGGGGGVWCVGWVGGSSRPRRRSLRSVGVPTVSSTPSSRRWQTHPLPELTGAAEIDDFDGGAFGVAEEDVLGFEVAVDDAELGGGEEEEGGAELLGEFPREVEGDAAEIGVAEEVVEVVGEELESQAEVVAEHEVTLQVDCRHGGGGGQGEKWGGGYG